MKEKRNRERRETLKFWPVLNLNTNRQLGYMVDITDKGILLHSERGLATNCDFRLRVSLDKRIFGRAHIDVTARSMWSKPEAGKQEIHATGFEIHECAKEDLETVRKLIDYFSYAV